MGKIHTVDERTPAPVDMENFLFFIGFHTSQDHHRWSSISTATKTLTQPGGFKISCRTWEKKQFDHFLFQNWNLRVKTRLCTQTLMKQFQLVKFKLWNLLLLFCFGHCTMLCLRSMSISLKKLFVSVSMDLPDMLRNGVHILVCCNCHYGSPLCQQPLHPRTSAGGDWVSWCQLFEMLGLCWRVSSSI